MTLISSSKKSIENQYRVQRDSYNQKYLIQSKTENGKYRNRIKMKPVEWLTILANFDNNEDIAIKHIISMIS